MYRTFRFQFLLSVLPIKFMKGARVIILLHTIELQTSMFSAAVSTLFYMYQESAKFIWVQHEPIISTIDKSHLEEWTFQLFDRNKIFFKRYLRHFTISIMLTILRMYEFTVINILIIAKSLSSGRASRRCITLNEHIPGIVTFMIPRYAFWSSLWSNSPGISTSFSWLLAPLCIFRMSRRLISPGN